MAVGGKREGAGRKKGVPNRRTAETLAAVREKGITPLEYLLDVMRNEDEEPERRLDAAKAAAPYCHQRMPQQTIVTGTDGGPVQTEDVGMNEIARRIAFVLTTGAKNKG